MINETVTLKGLTFRVTCETDCDMGPPWKEHDGHGEVREVRTFGGKPEKRPGERVLHTDRYAAWFYDWQGAMSTAKRDRWGLCDDEKAELAEKLGHAPTAGEITTEAVQRDFDHLRGYCNDDWSWVTVYVTLLDTDGAPTGETESLGGIESNSADYINECALELVAEIANRIGRRKFIETKVRVRT